MMDVPTIEALVVTFEGRCLLGQIAAAEGLTSTIGQHLSMLDVSEQWLMEIESARLEKLRDMAQKDGDASFLYAEADRIMLRQLAKVIQPLKNNKPLDASVAAVASDDIRMSP